MKKFDYAVVKAARRGSNNSLVLYETTIHPKDEYDTAEEVLEVAGAFGWELVSIHWIDSICFHATFKREIEEVFRDHRDITGPR